MAGRLDGRVAFVTGGSTGIGRATSRILAREGAVVVIADIAEEAAEETAALVRQDGGQAHFIKTNVANYGAVEEAVARVVHDHGRLDCAFNNAGIEGEVNRTAEYSLDGWDKVVAVNLTGVFYCMRAEIKQMLAQGGGAIVNTASVAGLLGFRGSAAYDAAKHGVVGLTKTAALEYATKSIRVNAVCPGVIETPMVGRITGRMPQGAQHMAQLHPIGRLGQPPEIGEAVAWLCSDASSFVTGIALPVDGGYSSQ